MTLWNLTKKSYKEIWRNILSIFMISASWFFSVGILIIFSIIGIQAKTYLPILLALFVVGPMTTQVFYIANRIINYHEVSIKHFWFGLKNYFIKSLLITLILVLVILVLTFYFNFLINLQDMLALILKPLYIYLLVLLGMISIYILPVMIELEDLDEGNSIKNIFKYSLRLTFDNFKYTLFIFFHIIIFGALNIGVIFALPTLFMGAIAIIANNATINLLVKYKIKQEINGPYDFE